MYTNRELSRLTGTPYTTIVNQMNRGYCKWPRHWRSGVTRNPAYGCWENMIQRCTNPGAESWSDYGGRGIKIDWRWRTSFAWFLEDVGERPSRKHSLDRINPNGHYTKDNVRWANTFEQAQTRRMPLGVQKHGRRYRFNFRNNTYTYATEEEALSAKQEMYKGGTGG